MNKIEGEKDKPKQMVSGDEVREIPLKQVVVLRKKSEVKPLVLVRPSEGKQTVLVDENTPTSIGDAIKLTLETLNYVMNGYAVAIGMDNESRAELERVGALKEPEVYIREITDCVIRITQILKAEPDETVGRGIMTELKEGLKNGSVRPIKTDDPLDIAVLRYLSRELTVAINAVMSGEKSKADIDEIVSAMNSGRSIVGKETGGVIDKILTPDVTRIEQPPETITAETVLKKHGRTLDILRTDNPTAHQRLLGIIHSSPKLVEHILAGFDRVHRHLGDPKLLEGLEPLFEAAKKREKK